MSSHDETNPDECAHATWAIGSRLLHDRTAHVRSSSASS